MASEIEIVNLALSHLGDTASVASLDPPEGSAQAEHCARFYPIARDSLLEQHTWKFATRRTALALLESDQEQWDYAYAKPSDCIAIIAVIDPETTDDQLASGIKTGKPFTVEINDDLAEVILTDQEDAVVRYICRTTDTTKFSPLFVRTLSHEIASMLAGPVLKGEAGAAEAKRQMQLAKFWLDKAAAADSLQRKVELDHSPTWIAKR